MSHAEQLLKEIQQTSFEHAFNPYLEECFCYDKKGAASIRFRLLAAIWAAAEEVPIHSLWVGRDLGYRGGRRTGLALTDDSFFEVHAARWGVQATNATVGGVVKERTAAVIWEMLSRLRENVLLWNVFPLHPHQPESPFSNRPHTRKEREFGEEVLSEVINIFRPNRVIAIGNDAYESVNRVAGEVEAVKVRHPSYGGQNEFRQMIRKLYDISCGPVQKELI